MKSSKQEIIEIIRWTCYRTTVPDKIKRLRELKILVEKARAAGKKVVLTNGCFDILHRGHLHLLREARALGDLLIVAINSDVSVKTIKEPSRPILPERERAELISALEMVNYVTIFDESDPYDLIQALKPDVLAKGGDWSEDKIIGKDIVEKEGGKVVVIPYLEGHSTTQIIERMSKG